jgi:hypothetical protein
MTMFPAQTEISILMQTQAFDGLRSLLSDNEAAFGPPWRPEFMQRAVPLLVSYALAAAQQLPVLSSAGGAAPATSQGGSQAHVGRMVAYQAVHVLTTLMLLPCGVGHSPHLYAPAVTPEQMLAGVERVLRSPAGHKQHLVYFGLDSLRVRPVNTAA